MGEREHARDEVDRCSRCRQRIERTPQEGGRDVLGPRPIEHLLGGIDADDPMAELGKDARNAARATRHIERVAGRKLGEQRPQAAFLRVDERVRNDVVRLRPGRVPVRDVEAFEVEHLA